MTRNSIQLLIIYTSLSLISAMPFLDTEDGPDKIQDEEEYGLPVSEFSKAGKEPDLDDLDLDMLTKNAILDILTHYKQSRKMRPEESEGSEESNEMPGFLSYRGKRFGFRFSPFSRHFRSGGNRRLFTNRVFVASRGKRQKYDDLDDLPYYPNLGLPEVKRRRGFTALRGR